MGIQQWEKKQEPVPVPVKSELYVLSNLSKDNNYKVYYIDISTLTQDEYNELVKTDEYMSQNEWGTPLNLLYKDGKRIDELNGYVSSDELVEFLKENKVI